MASVCFNSAGKNRTNSLTVSSVGNKVSGNRNNRNCPHELEIEASECVITSSFEGRACGVAIASDFAVY